MTTLLHVVNGKRYTVNIEKTAHGLYATINDKHGTIKEMVGDCYYDIHTATKRILKEL